MARMRRRHRLVPNGAQIQGMEDRGERRFEGIEIQYLVGAVEIDGKRGKKRRS